MRTLSLRSSDTSNTSSQLGPERRIDLLKILSHDLRGSLVSTIFRNLFRNAVKYCDLGGTINISTKHGNPFFLVKTYSSGRPITEEFQAKLFLKPLPPKDQKERNSDGMGLGLYLAKKILQTLGGAIWYEPEEHGTSFVLAIPVKTRNNRFIQYS